MNPHTHVTSTTSGRDVVARVSEALDALQSEYHYASALPQSTDTEHAVRAERLALICARRAGWWLVLERHTYSPGAGVPLVYGEAVIKARNDERSAARFWRDSARDWRADANGDRHGSGLWATWDHIEGRDERGAVA